MPQRADEPGMDRIRAEDQTRQHRRSIVEARAKPRALAVAAGVSQAHGSDLGAFARLSHAEAGQLLVKVAAGQI